MCEHPLTLCRLRGKHNAMNKTMHQYHLNMNDKVNAELEMLCEKSALTKAALLRKLITSEPIKERPHADFIKLTAEINNIGINFNQLVYKAHTVGYVTDEDLRETRAAFELILKKLHEWEKTWR